MASDTLYTENPALLALLKSDKSGKIHIIKENFSPLVPDCDICSFCLAFRENNDKVLDWSMSKSFAKHITAFLLIVLIRKWFRKICRNFRRRKLLKILFCIAHRNYCSEQKFISSTGNFWMDMILIIDRCIVLLLSWSHITHYFCSVLSNPSLFKEFHNRTISFLFCCIINRHQGKFNVTFGQ